MDKKTNAKLSGRVNTALLKLMDIKKILEDLNPAIDTPEWQSLKDVESAISSMHWVNGRLE